MLPDKGWSGVCNTFRVCMASVQVWEELRAPHNNLKGDACYSHHTDRNEG